MVNRIESTTGSLAISKGNQISTRFQVKSSIGQLLSEAAQRKDRGVTFIENDESETFVSYEELFLAAKKRLYGLQQIGVQAGDSVMVILEDNKEFLKTFWACILGGIIPAPLSYPQSFKTKSTALEKVKSIWTVLGEPLILSDERAAQSSINELLDANMNWVEAIQLDHENQYGELAKVDTLDAAFIQFSSGSTSLPKGVLLSHKNLLANIDSIVDAAQFTDMDRSLSWMPYHHDMGLIGFHLSMMAMQIQQYNMSPVKFVKKPILWLELITKHNITLTGCPNFGYRLLLARAKEEKLKKLNLHSLRLIFNGAEPIAVSVMEAFVKKLEPYGLKRSAMFPVYGMAEACVAACFPPCGSEPKIHAINRHTLNLSQSVQELEWDHKDAVHLADEGFPINGMDVRIVGETGEIVVERTIGEIQLRGPNLTSGYVNNEDANEKAFQDGWFRTGDTGFLDNGRLTVIGRIKDIIFCNGQNYYAHDIETKIEELEGVKPGKVAVCGWQDEQEGTEKVAVFSTLRVKESEQKQFYQGMLSHIRETTGLPIHYVIMINSIPKTTSGKVQRFELIKDFQNGILSDSLTAEELNKWMVSEKEEVMDEEVSLETKTMSALKQSWAEVLNLPIDQVPEDVSFLTLGGSSLKAFQVLGILEEELNVSLTHDMLIRCRTVSEMYQYLFDFIYHSNVEDEVAASMEVEDASETEYNEEDIAVIAMACRFPDASSPEAFWENLINGKDSINDIPMERFGTNAFFHHQMKSESEYKPKGAFLQKPFDFDPAAFGISEEEAVIMDPQQRLILELSYEVFERAGYSKEAVNGEKIGMYIGAGVNAYYEQHLSAMNQKRFKAFDSFNALSSEQQEQLLQEWTTSFGEVGDHPNVLVDNILNMIAARSSQTFNLKGPSMVIDTACSSSLVSLHMACEELAKGNIKMAIAGGIHLLLTATPYRLFNQAGALSEKGTSNVFDEKADGFVPGEGAGLVLLKPVHQAIKDGDHIQAVIKASAINNDGHSIGVMAPNPDGQREVVQSTYEQSAISPTTIQYMEAHGTGTPIGDPSEVRALERAFQRYNVDRQSIALGSVKANIGHLLSSAGIASFIKMVLSLEKQTLVPQINVHNENPMLHLDQTPFYIPKKSEVWEKPEGLRRGAINSFGFGGTNCHMILEESPNQSVVTSFKEEDLPVHSICLSAHTEDALTEKIKQLSTYLNRHNPNVGDVARTENAKTQWDYRISFSSKNVEDLKLKLSTFTSKKITKKKGNRNIVFMFTGQGSQYVGMGQQLYKYVPIFKQYFDDCSEAFRPYLTQSITELLFSEHANQTELSRTDITQPVVFAIDYALGRLLLELGVKPTSMIGHSVGEWVAATLAGVVTLEDAAKCVALRGRLMNELSSSGAMAAVFTSKDSLEELLEPFQDKVWIAGYNVTHQAVSGSEEALNQFLQFINQKGVAFKKLNVSQAFHTPLMKPMLEEFKRELDKISFSKPSIPIISNVTAEYMDSPMNAAYWIEHITSSVKFDQSVEFAIAKGANLFLEAGPDYLLAAMANAVSTSGKKPEVCSLINKKKSELEFFTEALGFLFERGIAFDWSALYKDLSFKKIQLPLYPFERSTFSPSFGDYSNAQLLRWFHEWQWVEDLGKTYQPDRNGVTLVVSSESDCHRGQSIANYLRETGEDLIYRVENGSTFNQKDSYCFTVNPSKASDWEHLKSVLPSDIKNVVFLSYGSQKVGDEKYIESWKDFLTLASFTSMQSMNQMRILVVTKQLHPLMKTDSVQNPYQALDATFANVLDTEAHVYASTIDVEEDDCGVVIEEELKRFPPEEGVALIRKGKRYVRALTQNRQMSFEDEINIEENDTYVFTGGAGSIGSEIALELASKAPINLVITGLTPLEESEYKRQLFSRLKSLGARVSYFAVDVGNRQEMDRVLTEVRTLYGRVDGVIHGAGLLSPETTKSLMKRDQESVEAVLNPKINGTRVLDELTRNDSLKFFVMLSSISASKKIWSAGLGDYAAANAFLDQYSYYRTTIKEAPGKTIAINYSLWEKEGIARSVRSLSTFIKKTQGLESVSSSLGSKVFFQALNANGEPVLHVLKEKTNRMPSSPMKREPIEKTNRSQKQQNVTLEKGAIRNLVYQITADQLQCPVDELETNRNFEELGIDSIRAVTVLDQIAQSLKLELNPTLLFEYQTPYELSKYLEDVGQASFIQEKEKEFSNPAHSDSDIAIIGVGLRFPGASTTDEYWNLLTSGRSVIKDTPAVRWSKEDHVSSDRESLHSSYSNRGGFIEQPYDFDPSFFGMSPSEAEATDPQQRLFLEVAWEAMQQAGYGSSERSTNVGVYVGCEQNTYMEHFIGYRSFKVLEQQLTNHPVFSTMDETSKNDLMETISHVLAPGKLVPDAVAGNGLNEVAARVNHLFNLTGPSMVINTACSSSLVAVHQACDALRTGQVEMALVGGVNLNLSPTPFASLSRVSALSPNGVCRPFDKDADGMVLSEGCSAVLLKPVNKAIHDNDHIYAVIKGSAINNDGRSQGITAPRPQGQAEAVRAAYQTSGINPETVSYIEAHGTGTPLGDPIEIEGLTQAFRHFTDKTDFCGIGSVKPTVGHMLAASGLSSLIKVALSISNQQLPPTLNFEEANQNIPFEKTPFYVVNKSQSWLPTDQHPLRAGINAFGFGGTNAHIILEGAPSTPEIGVNKPLTDGPQLMVINGKSKATLKKIASDLNQYVTENDVTLADFCFSLNTGQKALTHKVATIVHSKQHASQVLQALSLGLESNELVYGKSNPNKQVTIQLVLNGKPSMNDRTIEQVSNRFPEFEEDYQHCMNAIVHSLSEHEFMQWRSVAVEYALCCQLKRLGLDVEALHSSENGLLTGLLLKNKHAVDHVFSIFHDRHIVSETSVFFENGDGWQAPLFTGLGDAKTLTASEMLMAMDIAKPKLFTQKENWFSMTNGVLGEAMNNHECTLDTLLALIGSLVVKGVPLTLSKVAGAGSKHIPLPTYPFERSTYRITTGLSKPKEWRQESIHTISESRDTKKGFSVEELNEELQLLSESLFGKE
ncbi:SDR family NAD(P)-dependent oxidoreductase [Bacillus sp. C1-1]|nr:SDR family NAD(P)-dependent oxidoreductase [Bacillus sp. C1-1]